MKRTEIELEMAQGVKQLEVQGTDFGDSLTETQSVSWIYQVTPSLHSALLKEEGLHINAHSSSHDHLLITYCQFVILLMKETMQSLSKLR